MEIIIYWVILIFQMSICLTGNRQALGPMNVSAPPEYWCAGHKVEDFVKILVGSYFQIFFLKITVLCLYLIFIMFTLAPL